MSAPTLEQLDDETARRWLARALEHETTYHDTHPSLRARLEAIGMPAELLRHRRPARSGCSGRARGVSQQRSMRAGSSAWRPPGPSSREHPEEPRPAAAVAGRAGQALPTEQTLELATLEEDVGQGAAASLALRRAVVARDPAQRVGTLPPGAAAADVRRGRGCCDDAGGHRGAAGCGSRRQPVAASRGTTTITSHDHDHDHGGSAPNATYVRRQRVVVVIVRRSGGRDRARAHARARARARSLSSRRAMTPMSGCATTPHRESLQFPHNQPPTPRHVGCDGTPVVRP